MEEKKDIPGIIAIDGPAASGKTTLGRNLARKLDYLFFDTGVMYRAVTWMVLQRRIDACDEDSVTALASRLCIDVAPPSKDDGRSCDVIVDGKDITWDTRRPEVEDIVSIVSAYAGVRRELASQQRRIGIRGKVVMVGRDIGTIVLPEADLKIYLEASTEVRAQRRHDELIARGKHSVYEKVLAGVKERDSIDSTRDVAPLKPARDAVIINSDDLDIMQVLEVVEDLWK
ncbi:(d)CMP kinase [Chloroflexota bacterium]